MSKVSDAVNETREALIIRPLNQAKGDELNKQHVNNKDGCIKVSRNMIALWYLNTYNDVNYKV